MNEDGHDFNPPIPSSSEVSLGVRIDRICGEFENLLKAGQSPQIETFLREVPADHSETLLQELLGLELDYRAKAGDSFTSEEYTLRFPEHASTVSELVLSARQQKPADANTGEAGEANNSTPRQSSSAASLRSSQSPPRSRSSTETVRIGPYEIVEVCGRGGMGVVYKAWHEFFKQYRAIKVLPSDFNDEDISRFSMEIELAGRLNHPNIVRAHEANREQGILYLVMEFVDGINLDHLVRHHKHLPMGLACELIRQAAEGLQHADEHFLVHRDIKPSNLMLNRDGQVKILDFGLARLHAEHNASRLTKQGSVMGTLDFMAPEQWEDPMAATIQADIYSLGCTLYYLVTGTPPYGGEDYSHWLKKQEAHRKQPVPRIEHEHSEALQPIIDRMMAKKLEDRFAAPYEVVQALKPLADDAEVKRYAQTPAPKVSTVGLSHTPIPTINVSNADVLGSGKLAQLGDQFPSPDDSALTSKEKTLRPSQSATDRDADHHAAANRRAARPWHRSPAVWAGLAVLAVVLSSAMWMFFRPVPNTELAVQMGALPGLNGDWWFDEIPWYGPGLRKALMEALRDGETQIGDVSLANFHHQLTWADTNAPVADLQRIARELAARLPNRESKLMGRLLAVAEGKEGDQSIDESQLQDAIEKNFEEHEIGPGELSAESLAVWSATELHLFAGFLHWMSDIESQWVVPTRTMYEAAIAAYDEDDPVERVLQARAQADYSRFLADRRDFSASVDFSKRAAEMLPEAPLFQISLRCELADQYRKWEGNTARARAQLRGNGQTANAAAWADRMGLAEDHPLRAEILEREGWLYIDGWEMTQAIGRFQQAIAIRQANEALGNPFAWRPLLFNQQGQAMALHFLGNETAALAIYKKLIGEIIDPEGSSIARERLPNLYERKADVYLFGPAGNDQEAPDDRYRQAYTTLANATSQATAQGFQNSATLWFHLTRLYYKQSLAASLAASRADSAAEAKKVKAHAETAKVEAQNLESDFQQQMAADAFKKQQSVYEVEQKVAEAMSSWDPENGSYDQEAWKALFQLISNRNADQVNRTNIEGLLLVIQLIFEKEIVTAEKDLNLLGLKLLRFTEAARESSDPQIRQEYLGPVFNSAIKAIEKTHPSPTPPLSGTLMQLKQVIEPVKTPPRG